MPTKNNSPQEEQQGPISVAPMKLRDSINGLGFDLFNAAPAAEEGNNVFLSPFSIAMALGMTYPGANGDTAQALAAVLRLASEGPATLEQSALAGFSKLCERFKSTTEAKVQEQQPGAPAVRIANCVWANAAQEVSPAFSNKVVKSFNGQVTAANFESEAKKICNEINQWVEEATNNKIVNLLDDGAVDALTRMIIVNAIHFNAKFQSKFKKNSTVSGHPFNLLTAQGVVEGTCDMMKQTAHFPYFEDKTMQYVELPYVGSDMSLRIVVPKVVDGIHDVVKGLDSAAIGGFHTKATKCEVALSLPKFKVSGGGSIKSLLAALGMEVCFDENAADFSRIFTEPLPNGLFISDVIHKTFIDVNEEGTEAAAATAVVMKTRCRPVVKNPPKVVVVDRPSFVALTDHKTGVNLFVGKLMKPVIE